MLFQKVEHIADAKLLCTYRFETLETGQKQVGTMVLQVGDNHSKFESFRHYLRDSLGWVLNNQPCDVSLLANESSKIAKATSGNYTVDWRIYFNLPAGQRTITDHVFVDQFASEEPNDVPNWTILDEYRDIAGYKCQQAKASLYGRVWQVWFCPDIAVAEGPWLLKGLPGMVVQAEDDKRIFQFSLITIEYRKTPIIFVKSNYFKESRESVLRTKIRYYQNKTKYLQGTTVANPNTPPPSTAPEIFVPLRSVSSHNK